MPVRNLAPFVARSVASILDQSFRDFEFLILDDGSTDGTTEILRELAGKDKRIRLFERKDRLGPAGSSNFVVEESRAPLVARMDGDDISHPDRLRQQVEVLERDPGTCLVASLWEGIDESGRRVRPRDRSSLRRRSPFAPFTHGSIMFRRQAFDGCGGYRQGADFWEDLDLYGRMGDHGNLLVLPAALYQHRASALSTRLTSSRDVVEDSIDRMFRRTLRMPPRSAAVGPGKLLPQVFVSLGSTLVWAGRRPGMLRRILTKGELRLNFTTATLLAWALWAEVSPVSLRFCLAKLVAGRDHWSGRRIGEASAFRWPPAVSPASGDSSLARARAAVRRSPFGARPRTG